MDERVELVGKATKRKVEFDCPECGARIIRHIDKVPTSEADKLVKKIHVWCFICGALLALEPASEIETNEAK